MLIWIVLCLLCLKSVLVLNEMFVPVCLDVSLNFWGGGVRFPSDFGVLVHPLIVSWSFYGRYDTGALHYRSGIPHNHQKNVTLTTLAVVMWDVRYHIALTAVCALMTLFTLSNARRFNSSMGNRTPWQWEGYTGHERRREIKIKILLQVHFVPLLRSKIVHNNTGVFKWAYVIFFTQFIFFVASGRHRTYLNISSGQISTPKFGLKKYPANFNW